MVGDDQPTLDMPSTGESSFGTAVPVNFTSGDRIGRYVIREIIGEGGFATVYLAEQSEPVRRRVALKIIKLGMDTREVIARFEAERQALAMMDHPHVAHVFDAGATETGRPYFVMEYVPGQPITDYCDRHKLTTQQRLELLLQACDAVQHAHQKGIIHRDLKPSNVLVAMQDGVPQVKVIDFGVAKAISQRLTERTVYTELGQFIGTPEYMSPEQAELTGLDIDTRSDVYSLGVLMYELLVGALPFDSNTLREAGYAEMQRIIREQEPLKPSTRLSHLHAATDAATIAVRAGRSTDDPDTIAQQRRTDAAHLRRDLKGDLDWITLKALEKDRTRRYDSAASFAADIRRYLAHEPVTASPPSAIYRVRKFARRNRPVVVSGVAILMVLIAGIIATSIFAAGQARARADAENAWSQADRDRRAADTAREKAEQALQIAIEAREAEERERQRAEAALADAVAAREAEEQARQLAEDRRAEAERQTAITLAVNDFLNNDLLASVAPEQQGIDVTVREVLDTASNNIEGKFANEPLVEASVRKTLGETYRALGLYAQATVHFQRAFDLRRAEHGEENQNTATAMNDLAASLENEGRYAEAEPLQAKALEIHTRVNGPDHQDTITAMNNLAALYGTLGRFDEAEPLYLQVLEGRRAGLGEKDPSTITAMSNLSLLYQRQNRFDEAGELLTEVLELSREVLGDEHPDTLARLNNLATLLYDLKQYGEAKALYHELIEVRKRVLGPEHPSTLNSINNLGTLLWQQERYEEAEPLFIETLEIRRRTLGDDHLYTLVSLGSVGRLYAAQERFEEAEPYALQCYEGMSKTLGANHNFTRESIRILIRLYTAWEKPDEVAKWEGVLAPGEAVIDAGNDDGSR